MREFFIFTNEYDADIERLLKRRLQKRDTACAVEFGAFEHGAETADGIRTESAVLVRALDDDALDALCAGVSELMLLDLRHFELANSVERLPFSLKEKKRILRISVERTGDLGDVKECAAEVRQYLNENDSLNLEGFIRFRLKETVELWSAAVDAAADELVESEALSELFGLFGLTNYEPGSGGTEVAVIFNPDGSCTITNGLFFEKSDEKRFRIDCAPGNDAGVLGLIGGLSPLSVSLIDLSMGKCEELKNSLHALLSSFDGPPNG